MTKDKPEKRDKLKTPVAFDPVEAALKQMFDEVQSEEVPDDFADLIAKLSDKPAPEKPAADKAASDKPASDKPLKGQK